MERYRRGHGGGSIPAEGRQPGSARNNATMNPQNETSRRTGGEGDGVAEEALASYLAAIEQGDAADAPAPAAALAELLAARLDGTGAPAAQELLDSLVRPAGGPAEGGSP